MRSHRSFCPQKFEMNTWPVKVVKKPTRAVAGSRGYESQRPVGPSQLHRQLSNQTEKKRNENVECWATAPPEQEKIIFAYTFHVHREFVFSSLRTGILCFCYFRCTLLQHSSCLSSAVAFAIYHYHQQPNDKRVYVIHNCNDDSFWLVWHRVYLFQPITNWLLLMQSDEHNDSGDKHVQNDRVDGYKYPYLWTRRCRREESRLYSPVWVSTMTKCPIAPTIDSPVKSPPVFVHWFKFDGGGRAQQTRIRCMQQIVRIGYCGRVNAYSLQRWDRQQTHRSKCGEITNFLSKVLEYNNELSKCYIRFDLFLSVAPFLPVAAVYPIFPMSIE